MRKFDPEQDISPSQSFDSKCFEVGEDKHVTFDKSATKGVSNRVRYYDSLKHASGVKGSFLEIP